MLRLRVFGSPTLEEDEGPLSGAAAQRKSLALLALLARAGPAGTSRDRLLAYLWPEAGADRAGHRLTQLLYALRRDLRTEGLFLGSGELRLNPAVLRTDVAEFTAALERGEFAAAVAVYQAPFLDGFFLDDAPEFDRWVEGERGELARRLRSALEALAQAAARSGDPAAASEWWRRLSAADPLNARVAVAYMDALVAAGDRAAALQHARFHERVIQEELEVPVDSSILEAAARIRQQPAPHAALAPAARGLSVAVLPFLDISPDRDNEYFSDGMTEELTTLLARVPGLQVVSRTAAFALKGRSLAASEVGKQLRVEAFVEGSVRKVGDRIRVTAQLVDTGTGYQRWSETYDRKLENVFGLQEEVSRAIVEALPLGAGRSATVLVRPSTRVLEAYMLYLRGRFHTVRRTPESMKVAIEYFEQAVELDPDYGLAHAGLAECWMLLGFEEFGDLPPMAAMPTAKAAAQRALELDERLGEAYVWRGATRLLFDYDWPGAEADMVQAVELRPELPIAHAWFAIYLCAMGRSGEAVQRVLRAAELEPLMLSIQSLVGLAYYFDRRYDQAIAHLRALLSLDPSMVRVHVWLVRACYAAGRIAEGLGVIEDAIQRLGRRPTLLELLGVGYADLGRLDEARGVIAELERLQEERPLSGWHRAAIHLALGHVDEFRRLLDQLVDQRSGRIAFLAGEPIHDRVRNQTWFQAVLERLGLPALRAP